MKSPTHIHMKGRTKRKKKGSCRLGKKKRGKGKKEEVAETSWAQMPPNNVSEWEIAGVSGGPSNSLIDPSSQSMANTLHILVDVTCRYLGTHL